MKDGKEGKKEKEGKEPLIPQVKKSQSRLVEQGVSSPVYEGESYLPGHLTSCAMVFAIGSNGHACVYHWPGHTWSTSYIETMHAAIKDYQVSGTIHYCIFGMDAPQKNLLEKTESSWREFGQRFSKEFGQPEIYLVEEPYTNPILTFKDGSITTIFSNRKLG